MRYFIVILLLFVISCSPNSGDVKNDIIKTSKNETVNLNTDYQYEKLDVTKLYSNKEEEDVLKEIDLSDVKNIETSLLYSLNDNVYIKRSPLEIYELLVKKGDKKTIEDNILFLELSLELAKNKNIDKILNTLNKEELLISDIKQVDTILSRFNLFDEEIKLIDTKLNKLLKSKKKFNSENEFKFLSLLKMIKVVNDTNLLKNDTEKYIKEYFTIDRFNKRINEMYINNLVDNKKYKDAEIFINSLLSTINSEKLKYNKSSLLTLLTSIYNKSNQKEKIKDLYLSNSKLPENRDLFYQYINYLKVEKIWSQEFKNFAKTFNTSKNIDNFYRYYFALKHESKDLSNILSDYYNYLITNKDELATKELSNLLIENGKLDNAYNLLNIALINYKNSEFYDDYIISMSVVINRLVYNEQLYSSYYFFSVPDFIGGVLSLIQNQYKNNNFLGTIDSQHNINERISDMNFLFETNKKLFKSNDKFAVFLSNYFDFLRRYRQGDEIKNIVSFLRKINKDIAFNIFLLKTTLYYASNVERDKINKEIYNLYLKLLDENKNDKDKFSKYLSETMSALNKFDLSTSIKLLQDLIEIYPENENLYVNLLSLLENYRAYDKKLDVYEKALLKFNKKTWADKYSRYLIRKKWNDKMVSLNKKLINLLNKDEYSKYLNSVFTNKQYGAFNSPFNQLYEKVYLDALEKYPFNLAIINKLLRFYDDFRYTYRYKSYDAINKYAFLLYKYIYINDDFRNKYFKDSLITKNMNHDNIIASILKKDKKSIPDLKYLAYMLEYRGEFEESVKYYSILSRYYITDQDILFKTAKLYKSLASSFYIENPDFLTKSESLYKRLSFLYRNESKYYISLAELYYELLLKDKAEKTLFRALEYEKGTESKYIDIANMFYDFYDYDNALKSVYSYRNRKSNDDLLIPFVGRLFELKNNEKLAVNEYFRDFLNKNNDSYQSEKRLKTLLNKKALKDIITLKIEESLNSVIKDEVLFSRFKTFLSSINNDVLLKKLYSTLYENGTNVDLLKKLYYIFIDNKDKRAEALLKKIEKLEQSDNVYSMMISFYKENKKVKEVSTYYEKMLISNPYENDKYTYINIMMEYASYLIKNKEYDASINKYKLLNSHIKSDEEKLTYKLRILNVYKLQSKEKQLKYLLQLDSEYPTSRAVSGEIFNYYRDTNKLKEMIDYLTKLIKRTKAENSLSYNEKKYRIASYRELLIQQLIALKMYSSVLDQYIEILNRNPLDEYMAKKVYNFAKINKIDTKLFDYYEKLSKKSFKNHKYLLLNANINSLRGDFNKTLDYFQKALKIEPQEMSIKFSIAETLVKLKRFEDAYKVYNDLYLVEKNNYTKKVILKKMFEVSMHLNNKELIADLASRIVKMSANEAYYNVNTDKTFVAKTLYQYSYLNMARMYYKEIIVESISKKQYLNSDIIYQYSKTFIDKGEGVDLIKELASINTELLNLDRTRYRYVMDSGSRVLLTIISEYIPDNISYFSNDEIKAMNSYLDSISNINYSSYIGLYYKKLNFIDKYFSRLTGKYVNSTKNTYYESILDYDTILNQELYKVFNYNGSENVIASNYKEAFLTYVWKDKNLGFKLLEENTLTNCTGYARNNVATDAYVEYLRKNKMDVYKNLVKNKCIYSNILSSFIKYKEKDLAIQLINNQFRGELWSLQEKIKLYWSLKEFNKEGVELYNKLLQLNLTISNQIDNEVALLNESEWNNTVVQYSNYVLKSNISDIDLSNNINNIIEIAPKSVKAYLAVSDIYFNNKKYKESIEYLNYAKQLKSLISIDIKLADAYLKLGDLEKFNKVNEKILKSDNLNDFYKFYSVLKDNKKLDAYFISTYNDLLMKNYKTYGFYKLKIFVDQIIDYYSNLDFEKLSSFVDNFKDGKSEIYKSMLISRNYSFNNDYKLKLFNKIIDYYSEIDDLYNRKTWILAKTEFLSKIKQYTEAIDFLSKHQSIFTYEDKSKYDFYIFKLYYNSKDIEKSKELFSDVLKNSGYSEYGIDYYFNFVYRSNDAKLSKEFLLSFLTPLRDNYKLSLVNLGNLLSLLDNDKLKVELLYLINNRGLDSNGFPALESLTSKRGLTELYNLILDNKYNKYYHNYNYKKMNNYSDNYYMYILDLIKLNKQEELKIALLDRKLSISELNAMEGKITSYSKEEKEIMLSNLILNNQDVFYIKSLLNYALKKYDNALSELNNVNPEKDYKYNMLKPVLNVKLLSELGKLNDLNSIKEALKISNNKDLKLMLFTYFLNNNDSEKAFFVLGKMGLNLYLTFDGITGRDFGYLSVYSNRYNDYNDNYYNYYQPEAIAEKAFKKEESNTYMFIENFISSFKDNEKKVVVNFLYDQYKKYSTHKELGLSILYSYSKIDSKYKAEFEELKK